MSTISLASEDLGFIESGKKQDFYQKYRLGDTLGEGLSSVVRRCFSKESQMEYAVKIIDKSQETENFVRLEMNILSCLDHHPNIIKLIDSYETTANFFLVFNLAPGGELFDYLTRMVLLPEKQAKMMFKQILNAVEYMHLNNIVHRDLKPENILLENENFLYISDFGFAVKLEDGQLLKDMCGTPDYIAPEVLKCSMDDSHSGYGKPVDLWACGVILFVMLVGFSPFWHRKQSTMLWNIMDGKYNLNSHDWENISNGAKDLISKLLVVDPVKRFNIEQTLSHPWIMGIQEEFQTTKKKLSFKVIAWALINFKYVYKSVIKKRQYISMVSIKNNPYQLKFFRHIMDTCAFHLYDHWIKRSNIQDQNRTALFQNTIKKEECDDHCVYTNFQQRRVKQL